MARYLLQTTPVRSGLVSGDNLPPGQVVAELETAGVGTHPTSIATQTDLVDSLVHASTGAVVKGQKVYRKERHLLADVEGAAVLELTDFFPVHIPIITNSNDPAHSEEPLASTVEAAGAAIPSSYLIDNRANDVPTLGQPSSISLVDTASADTFVSVTGTFNASDAEGMAQTYWVVGGTSGSYTISGASYTSQKTGAYATLYVNSSSAAYVFVADASAVNTLAAFDYSTYGILHGELTSISSDTLQEQGPNGQTSVFYLVQVRVLASAARPEKARVFLKPSMTASLDIRTKIRPVLEYFLKPTFKAFDDALMER